MPLTPQESFKVGFLARCAHEGLTPDQMLDRVKRAGDMLEKRSLFDSLVHGAGGVAKGLAGYGIPMALAAPPILGGLGGYALAKATDVDDTDVDAIKNQELVDEYQRQSQRIKRQNDVRAYAKEPKHHSRALM